MLRRAIADAVAVALPRGGRRSILAIRFCSIHDQAPVAAAASRRNPCPCNSRDRIGKTVSATVDARTLLVEFLRNDLGLTGTHVGCDTGQCGACTVQMDGRAVKACNMLAAQANGTNVVTIEGLADADGTLHPMQAAFKECPTGSSAASARQAW